MTDAAEWRAITRRNARSVQTTIGWIFWDPRAIKRYEALGLPGPLGYIASRAAPLAPAGPDAVIAAFGSITPLGIRAAFDVVRDRGVSFDDVWRARDEAVREGLAAYAPAIQGPLEEVAAKVWDVAVRLPTVGRPFAAAHLRIPRPDDPVLSVPGLCRLYAVKLCAVRRAPCAGCPLMLSVINSASSSR
jgi:hypothetical protein